MRAYYGNKKSKIVHGRKNNDPCRLAEIKESNRVRFPSVHAALKAGYRLCKLEWKMGADSK